MKAVILLTIVLTLPAFSARGQDTNNAPGPTAVTIDGVTYEDVRWGTVTPFAVSVFHSTGIASIPLEKLPPELQQQFGYDPKKAAEYRAAETDAQAKRKAEQQAQTEATARVKQTQPPASEALKGTTGYLDARNGFRDLKFGQYISQTTGMRPVKTDYRGGAINNLKMYVRDADVLKIGTARLDSIIYVFYKGKLMEVQLSVKSDEDLTVITGAFAGLYGEGQAGSWEGEKIRAQAYIGGMRISDKGLEAQMEEDETAERKARAKEAAREGANGF